MTLVIDRASLTSKHYTQSRNFVPISKLAIQPMRHNQTQPTLPEPVGSTSSGLVNSGSCRGALRFFSFRSLLSSASALPPLTATNPPSPLASLFLGKIVHFPEARLGRGMFLPPVAGCRVKTRSHRPQHIKPNHGNHGRRSGEVLIFTSSYVQASKPEINSHYTLNSECFRLDNWERLQLTVGCSQYAATFDRL